MNKTTAETSDADDWLTPLLVQDAHGDPSPPQDAAFVAQVLARLDVPPAAHVKPPMPKVHTALAQGRGLLLGFQMLVVVFLCAAAPSLMQAWLHIAQTPMDPAAWQTPHVWGFVLGLGMLVYGVHELTRLPDDAVA